MCEETSYCENSSCKHMSHQKENHFVLKDNRYRIPANGLRRYPSSILFISGHRAKAAVIRLDNIKLDILLCIVKIAKLTQATARDCEFEQGA